MSKGSIFYGMHFYPGVAEYQEPNKDAYRIFLNEDTIRSMDPTFAGRPVFVKHVDDVSENMETLKNEADGWVVESFYNVADGKHWVKFIVVSDRGEQAIKRGWRLSNCYRPTSFGNGGLWNGVQYAKEVTGGEYEHLALVPDPRYDESEVLTPEQFKKYNEDKTLELKRLANSEKEPRKMLSFFQRKKVENSSDLENTVVVLPKTGRQVEISKLVEEADVVKNDMAHPEHMVDMGDGMKMHVKDCVEGFKKMRDELAMHAKNAEAPVEDKSTEAEGAKEEHDVSMNKEDDEEAKKKALQLAEHEDKEIEEAKKKNELDAAKKAEAAAKAERLKNAPERAAKAAFEASKTAKVEIMADQVSRGKKKYGS